MGWSIDAYYNISNIEIDYFIQEHNIKNNNEISKHFYEKLTGKEYNIYSSVHYYNKDGEHYIYEYYQCNCIRDHKKLHEKPPNMLGTCLLWIRSSDDAIQIAKNLRDYYHDDDVLINFAEWLETTSKYCHLYKLSM